jgi:NADH-quinone oxidoreductase subunit G
LSWQEATAQVRRQFKAAADRQARGVVGVLSPFLTCEEAFLLATWLKGLNRDVQLALGPVPVVGQDDTYPKNCRGQAVQPVKFTIRAEKCPNRKGVEAVLGHFQGTWLTFEEVIRQASEGQFQAVYLAAGYPPRTPGWISAEQAQALGRVETVVCHDLHQSPASALAHLVLPAASFAEKDGTFVNHSGLAQAINWGVTPTGECRTDGQVFLDLLERRGLIHVPSLRKELAAQVPAFAPLAVGDLPDHGIPLELPK